MERSIAGKSYTFRCIDPDYCDAGSNRNGALFLCDTIIAVSYTHLDVYKRQKMEKPYENNTKLNAGEGTFA